MKAKNDFLLARRLNFSILIPCFILMFVFVPSFLFGGSYFKAVSDGNWSNVGNWLKTTNNGSSWFTPAFYPGDGDTINDAAHMVTLDIDISVSSKMNLIGLCNGTHKITVTASGTLIIGAISGETDYYFNIDNNGTCNIGIIGFGGTFNNYGTVNLLTGIKGGIGLGTFNNNNILNIENGFSGTEFQPTLNNYGTINKITSNTFYVNGVFSNSGTVNVQSGELKLLPPNGTYNYTGIINISSGAILDFSRNNNGGSAVTHNISSAVSGAGKLVLEATNVYFLNASAYTGSPGSNISVLSGNAFFNSGMTFNFPDTLYNTGTLNLNTGKKVSIKVLSIIGGAMNGSDSVEVITSGSISSIINISSPFIIKSGAQVVSGIGPTLNSLCQNYGTLNIGGRIFGTGTLNNFNILNINNSISGHSYESTLNNYGTINKNTYSNTFSINGAFNNSGTVNVQLGTLNITPASTSSGNISISSGATLSGGALNFSGTSFTNNGTLSSSPVNITGNTNLSGTGSVTSASFNIKNGGILSFGSNHQLSVMTTDIGGTVNLNDKMFSVNGNGTPLTTNGTLNCSLGTVRFNGSALQSTRGIPYNAGSITINNSNNVNLYDSVNVNDTLFLQSGNFNTTGKIVHLANIKYLGGTITPAPSSAGNVNVTTSTFTAPTNITNLTVSIPAGTTLGNNTSVAGTLNVSGGTLNTGANTVTLGSSGTVTETVSNFIKGNITTTRTVPAGSPDASQSFGNLGITLGDGADNLGNVTVTRVAGVPGAVSIFGADTSIRRKWTITAENQPVSGRDLTLSWTSADDNGRLWSASRKAQVWKSTDNGTTWIPVGSSADVSASDPRSITVNVNSFSIYTIADAPLPSDLNLTVIPSGFYDAGSSRLNSKDTIKVYLRNALTPYAIVDSAVSVIDSLTFTGLFKFTKPNAGNYYLVIKHRNSLETWSKTGGETFTAGIAQNYNFTTSQTQAFGTNLVQVGTKWCLINGDCNGDGYIDGSDYLEVINHYDESGYLIGDCNGDGYVDGSDYLAIINNYDSGAITPLTPSKMIRKMKKDNLKNRKTFQEIKKKIIESVGK